MGASSRDIRATILALLMITSVLAVVPTASADHPSNVPEGQVFNASDNVYVWDRAIFPARVDGRDYATSVTPPQVYVEEATSGNERPLVNPRGGLTKNPVGVFTVGDNFDYDFVDGRAGSGILSNQGNVEVIAARFENDSSGTVPTTFSEALDLLTLPNANDNASFFEVTNSASLNQDGELSLTSTSALPTGGHRVIFFAVREPGKEGFDISSTTFEINSIEGNVTIIGATAFSTQRAPATVNAPSSGVKGRTIKFDIDSTAAFDSGDDVTHAVALYKQDTFQNAEHRVIVDENDVGTGFTVEDDADLETSIQRTVGVADVEDGITLNGQDINDGHVARGVGPTEMIDFISETIGSGSPDITATGSTTLYASINATAGDPPQKTVRVDTLKNFSTGTYRWVYVGKLDHNDSAISTATGTISIQAASPATSGGGGGGGGDDDGQPSQPPAQPPRAPQATSIGNAEVSATSTNGQVNVNIRNANAGDQVTIQRNDQDVQDEVEQDGSALEEIQTSFSGQTDFDMQISSSADNPDPSAPDPPSGDNTVGYLNVQHNAPDTAVAEVQFTFRVSQQRLDDRGISRDNVVLYHFDSNTGQWSELQTEFVGEAADGTPRFRSTSRSLSIFAIGSRQAQVTATATPTPEPTEAPPTDTPAPTTTTDEPVQEPGGFGPLTIGLVVVVVLVIIGGALYYRREQL